MLEMCSPLSSSLCLLYCVGFSFTKQISITGPVKPALFLTSN